MMTGMPPPRLYDYNWQISRMNDRGFSQPLREIIGSMLRPHPADRPTVVDLVNTVNYQWKKWRADTPEGRQFVDVTDKIILARSVPGIGPLLRTIV
jgi:hypothetical protein